MDFMIEMWKEFIIGLSAILALVSIFTSYATSCELRDKVYHLSLSVSDIRLDMAKLRVEIRKFKHIEEDFNSLQAKVDKLEYIQKELEKELEEKLGEQK
jgi:hypothetical protein